MPKTKQRRRQRATAKVITQTERRVRAIALRRQGKTFREIAVELGITPQRCHAIVMSAIDYANEQLVHETEALRQEQLDRLHKIIAALWKRAQKGELAAIDRLERLMAREAKLAGLDAAEKFEHGGPGGTALTPLILIPPESDD